MSTHKVIVDEVEYDVAPLEPELHDRPSPAYPMAITPQVARAWLAYNYRNRHQRASGKRDYSHDMAMGNFEVNGTSVTFSRPLREGEDPEIPAGRPMLIDGQHRLESCIQANKPFVVYVAYGLKPTARRTVDTGIKRQLADVFSMEGEVNATVLAAVVKRAYAWTNGDKHLTLKAGVTHTQAQEFLAWHPELRRSTEIASRCQGAFHQTTLQDLRQSVTGFAHWLFMQADETRAPEFFARVGDGSGLLVDHPIAHLRRRLIRDKTEPRQDRGETRRTITYVQDWQILCYFIRTWNECLRGPQADGSYRTFAILGGKDKQKIPDILTAKDVEEINAEKEKDAVNREQDAAA